MAVRVIIKGREDGHARAMLPSTVWIGWVTLSGVLLLFFSEGYKVCNRTYFLTDLQYNFRDHVAHIEKNVKNSQRKPASLQNLLKDSVLRPGRQI